jgi:hypothetical protein
MKYLLGIILVTLLFVEAHADGNDDMFNFYKSRDDNDYGPEDWNKVRCDDPDQCVSAADRLRNSKKEHHLMTPFGI